MDYYFLKFIKTGISGEEIIKKGITKYNQNNEQRNK